MEDYIEIEDMFDINVLVCEVVSHDKRKVSFTVTQKSTGKTFDFTDVLKTDGSYFELYFVNKKPIKEVFKETFDIDEDEAEELRLGIKGTIADKEIKEKVKVFFENVEIKERGEHETIISYNGKDYKVYNRGFSVRDECYALFEETYQIRDISIFDDLFMEFYYIPPILKQLYP